MSLHGDGDVPCGPAALLGGAGDTVSCPADSKFGLDPGEQPTIAQIIAGANGQQTANLSMQTVLLIIGVSIAALAFIFKKGE